MNALVPDHKFSERGIVYPQLADPLVFVKIFWPSIRLYRQQREILESFRYNYETISPAGNELGKDFVAALATLWFFCSRTPCRIVTTSPNSTQLEKVLWGEIKRLLDTADHPLPVQYNHQMLRKYKPGTKEYENTTECIGRTVNKGESLLGFHTPRTAKMEPMTALIVDEASGMDDEPYEVADTWTHRKLVIGNPYTCSNFFFKGTQEGDKEVDSPYYDKYRKVIRIRASDSPNVRYAQAELEAGRKVSHTEVIPGVVTYAAYMERRQVWDKVRQTIGLDAEFYMGAELLMYPPDWRAIAYQLHKELRIGRSHRIAKGIGVDPAEGGDSSVFTAVDEFGLIEQLSLKTPDTTECVKRTIAFARKHRVQYWHQVGFDAGGGGKQHADNMRDKGYSVRTVAFGGSPTDIIRSGIKPVDKRREEAESRYVYKNKRAEMAHQVRLLIDPSENPEGWAIPEEYDVLAEEMAPIPIWFDGNGQIVLPPKHKPPTQVNETKMVTLVDLIGHSPDHLDSLMVAVHMMKSRPPAVAAGGADAKLPTTGF